MVAEPAGCQRNRFQVNGIELHYLSAGAGPLVIFMHGFPQLGRSWAAQMMAVAGAGYHAVAPDMRGYGDTESPDDPELYSQFHLAGDVTGLMDHLGASQAVLVGHDMGAGLAWAMGSFLPERVRGVIALSVPHKPRGDTAPVAASPPLFYQRRFQTIGPAEEDLATNLERFLPGIFDRLSGSSERGLPPALMVPEDASFSDLFDPPTRIPEWLAPEELDAHLEAFGRTGFRGALNWYRNIDRNWYQLAPWAPGNVTVPAAFLVGDRDVTYALFHGNGVIDSQSERVSHLFDSRVIPGAGHWIAQERPTEVNEFLLSALNHIESLGSEQQTERKAMLE